MTTPQRSAPTLFPCGVKVYDESASSGYLRVVWHDPATGKRRSARRSSRPEAEQAAWGVVRQLESSGQQQADKGQLKVSSLVRLYQDPATHDVPWGVDYRRRQTSIIDTWILPRIGELRCADLTGDLLRGVIVAAREAGRQESTLQSIAATLSGIVSTGRARGYILEGASFGKLYKSRGASTAGQARGFVDPRGIPPAAEIARLGDYMGGRWEWRLKLMVDVAAYSGLRLGELVALDAIDVSVDDCTIDVTKAWRDVEQTIAMPKFDKQRTTIFPAGLRDMMARRVDELGGVGLMFPAPRGGLYRPPAFHGARFGPARRALDWPRHPSDPTSRRWAWTWHDLRHNFCTWALSPVDQGGLGLDVADVAYFAGHHSPSFTYARYVSRRDAATNRALAASTALAGRTASLAAVDA